MSLIVAASVLTAIAASDFELDRDVAGDARRASALKALNLRRVSLDAVLADTNRFGRRVGSVPGVAKLDDAFEWNAGDRDTEEWYPQGVAGRRVHGRRVVAVSWYDKSDVRGVRVSFVDATHMDDVRYRHVLLVEPFQANGRASFRPVKVHAGGIAWLGPLLYVADTSNGFRVFDTRELREVSPSQAFDYKYVLPQTSAWRHAPGSKHAVFSSVSVDRSTSPASLVTCEYRKDSKTGRAFRWKLGARSMKASEAYTPGVNRMQGVVAYRGQWFLSCSSQHGSRGSLYVARPGGVLAERSWAEGAESVHFGAIGGLWSLTEHPGERRVFRVLLQDYD